MRALFRIPPSYWLAVATLHLLPLGADAQNATNPTPLDTIKPTGRNRQIARVVSTLLQREHVSGALLEDKISRRALDLYVQWLDSSKLYFLQSDIDEFQPHATQLDDRVNVGDVSPGFEIFQRFLERMDTQAVVIDELLSGEFDFTVDESVCVDPDERTYAQTAQELRDRWRRELKLQLLMIEAQGADAKKKTGADIGERDPKPVETLHRRYIRTHARMHRLDRDQVLERYLNSITTSFDPHTNYMSPGTLEQFMIRLRLNLEGIGAELRESDGHVKITRVLEGGGASQNDQIKVGDEIVAVDEYNDGSWLRVVGMSVGEVASRVRGKSGTKVGLKLLSKDGRNKETRIVRSRIELQNQRASGKVVPFETNVRERGKVGYVSLKSFYRDTSAQRAGRSDFRSCSRDVKALLDQFRDEQVDAVVLDLRGNGGGLLEEAIDIVGFFVDRGPVVQVKEAGGNIIVHRDEEAGVAWSGPLAVLTDKHSASASEIVAGAIQDYHRGIIIGDPQTHGKGTVQTPLDLSTMLFGTRRGVPTLGSLKMTTQMYYLPDGESTQLHGVSSDVVLPSTASEMAMGESELEYALPTDKVGAKLHQVYPMRPQKLLEQIRLASMKRVSGSDSFKKTLRQIEAFRERKERSRSSVKRSEFLLSRQRLMDKFDNGNRSTDDQAFPCNDYELEVLEVVQDYIQGLTQLRVNKLG